MSRATVIDGKKKCPKCGVTKPVADYNKKNYGCGVQVYCRDCANANLRARSKTAEYRAMRRADYAKNAEARRAYASAWRAARVDAENARARACYQKHKAKRIADGRAYVAKNRAWILAKARTPEARAKRRVADKRKRARRPELARIRSAVHRAKRAKVPTQEIAPYVRVLMRDPCSYCGKTGGTIDHVVPLSKGGSTGAENLTASCASCNSKKNNKSLLMFLLGAA